MSNNASSAGPPGSVRQYDLVAYLEADRLADARRARQIGLVALACAFLIAAASIATVYAMLPYLDRTEYVMFTVDKARGIVRQSQRLDEPFNPDARVREYFINKLVVLHESFVRSEVDRNANVLRHYLTRDLLDAYVRSMRALNEVVKSGTRTVEVDTVLPITKHYSGQALNQSTVDFTVTTTRSDSTEDVRPMVAILTYRFVPYTKAELESTDEDLQDRIRKNPLGMEVVSYRVDARLPKHQP